MINCHTTPIFVKNNHERPFSIIPKGNTYGFLTKKLSPLEIQECDLWQWNIFGVRCTSLWSMINGHTTPIFLGNSNERPFSITPKANTYGFLTKKWSPPEIPECDLWQGNICRVRWTSLLSMINGHTTPKFVENSHERPFSMSKIVVHGFFRQKWGLCGHWSSTKRSYTSRHISFLVIHLILGFLVETISWSKIRRC
jgi:hypothetical protein